MDFVEVKTLVDITQTRVSRPNQGTQLELEQHRNFITLLQCAEIRSIVIYQNPPTIETIDIKDIGFGTNYKGNHRVWTFTFTPDREYVYRDDDGNDIGHLINDITQVPVIINLTETINIDKAIFDCSNTATKNTIIKAHLGTI